MSIHAEQLHDSQGKVAELMSEPTFYYFAYGSCMCPVDLKRSFSEDTHSYVIGPGKVSGYRLRFSRRSLRRQCGALDIIPDPTSYVEGVLYQLPWSCPETPTHRVGALGHERLSDRLDEREEIPRNGYRREAISVECGGQIYEDVRTYVVVQKLPQELAPNDWYFHVVMRGAVTCGLSEEYCWKLFHHMHQLQQHQWGTQYWRSA
ncbi:MAG: gamma-glutamylcyclotransferase [Hormoscilla sp. SP5CHS1]|nr:gamma-glutamylcyclotransferase [Hormoscilla sp. SP5CHS1]